MWKSVFAFYRRAKSAASLHVRQGCPNSTFGWKQFRPTFVG
jgi:hypothetical protein